MAFSVWVLAIVLVLASTWLTLRRLDKKPAPPKNFPPVSILKPLKGLDIGLKANLESFFLLDYPEYELIFSVAEANDPAISVVHRLQDTYPNVRARLIIGAETLGWNPKVNNLLRSYQSTRHDLLLISDSNVKVEAHYLREMVAELTEGVGVVTAVVAGTSPRGVGGLLETIYLNSFYARGLNLAFACGKPCVVGKSMLFRKSVADRFGGLEALANYLAEDYMLGEKMAELGLRVALAHAPIEQFVGRHSFQSFWQRHLRWGRIRKAHAPLAFFIEPLFTPLVSGILGGIALGDWIGLPLFGGMHLFLWMICDLSIDARLAGNGQLPLRAGAWLLREALALPLWLAVAMGNTVDWRGHQLRLRPGGRIEGIACGTQLVAEESQPFFGEQPPVPTKLRATT